MMNSKESAAPEHSFLSIREMAYEVKSVAPSTKRGLKIFIRSSNDVYFEYFFQLHRFDMVSFFSFNVQNLCQQIKKWLRSMRPTERNADTDRRSARPLRTIQDIKFKFVMELDLRHR